MDAIKQQAWDEAAERVGGYLAALDAGGAEHRTRATISLIEQARRRCEADPGLHPVRAAMAETIQALETWYGSLRPGSPETGVTAFIAAGTSETWPNAILSGNPPAEMVEKLSELNVAAGPGLALSSMAAREMNFGAMETIAQETWQKFDWAPVIRAAAIWTAIFFIALYVYDRFFSS